MGGFYSKSDEAHKQYISTSTSLGTQEFVPCDLSAHIGNRVIINYHEAYEDKDGSVNTVVYYTRSDGRITILFYDRNGNDIVQSLNIINKYHDQITKMSSIEKFVFNDHHAQIDGTLNEIDILSNNKIKITIDSIVYEIVAKTPIRLFDGYPYELINKNVICESWSVDFDIDCSA